MFNTLRGNRPDLTPAQFVAVLAGGVPVLSNLLSVFGVFSLSALQQQALVDSMTWGGILGGLLIGGDALVRGARNAGDAKVNAAALTSASEPPTIKADVNVDTA